VLKWLKCSNKRSWNKKSWKWRSKFLALPALLFSVAITLTPPNAYAVNQVSTETFDVMSQDKQLHMAASYGMALTGTMILRSSKLPLTSSLFYSSLLTMAVFTAKEAYYDREFSKGDMLANSIGVGANVFFATTFSF
jgi:hypothetical protein